MWSVSYFDTFKSKILYNQNNSRPDYFNEELLKLNILNKIWVQDYDNNQKI